MKTSLFWLVAALGFVPLVAPAAGLAPWEFGMSKKKVASFRQFGPYKTFQNGDLETKSGKFHGQAENIQFFFKDGSLDRIGIYLFEGKNFKQSFPVWQRVFAQLQEDYGKIDISNIRIKPERDPLLPGLLVPLAAANMETTGETLVTPATQPKEMRVSAKYWKTNVHGDTYYFIAVFLDPPPNAKVKR